MGQNADPMGLAAGFGAGGVSDTLLKLVADRRAQAMFEENQRQARAEEAFRQQQLAEQTQLRQATLAATTQDRADRLNERKEAEQANIEAKGTAAADRRVTRMKVGTRIPVDEYQQQFEKYGYGPETFKGLESFDPNAKPTVYE